MKIQEVTRVELTAEERSVLEGIVRSATTQQRLVERARIVLLAAAGLATRAIHRGLGWTIGASRASAMPPAISWHRPTAGSPRASICPF
jgi:hypothetical protein